MLPPICHHIHRHCQTSDSIAPVNIATLLTLTSTVNIDL
jgi:hypothetical protein